MCVGPRESVDGTGGVVSRDGCAGQPRPGDLPGGQQAVQAFNHPRRLLPKATQDDDVSFKQDGVGGREQREQERLAPEAT